MQQLQIFRALADPTRLRIISLLRAMELSVGELAQVLGQSQPRVSRHIRILCDCGLARRRKEGSWVFLMPGPVKELSGLFAALDSMPLGSSEHHWQVADRARLAAVRSDRASAAQAYFDAHAGEWDALRSLHIAESEVEVRITDIFSSANCDLFVDIGTGTGRMIELLGERAKRAIGIDRNPEMLRLARAKLSDTAMDNWELLQGDINALPLEGNSADWVIFHQVLHYSQSPESALAEAARILRAGGKLLIVDFAPHDREELRDQHAHARLGFSDDQIETWLGASGMEMEGASELAGGALTVKFWLGSKQNASQLRVVGQ
jgi:ubiquinone/menaquinone biosynthesis C-methylase UbiE/DNA-binding transcriptional ArsR family regulator